MHHNPVHIAFIAWSFTLIPIAGLTFLLHQLLPISKSDAFLLSLPIVMVIPLMFVLVEKCRSESSRKSSNSGWHMWVLANIYIPVMLLLVLVAFIYDFIV